MPNLTISASTDVLRRLRVEAAIHNQSVSRFVGEILREKFQQDDAYEQAMDDFFSRSPYLEPPARDDGRAWPTRAELYDRPVTR